MKVQSHTIAQAFVQDDVLTIVPNAKPVIVNFGARTPYQYLLDELRERRRRRGFTKRRTEEAIRSELKALRPRSPQGAASKPRARAQRSKATRRTSSRGSPDDSAGEPEPYVAKALPPWAVAALQEIRSLKEVGT